MIFPAQDRILLTHELGTYGITYVDLQDCLVIAPGLKGRADCIGAVDGVTAASNMVCLLFLEKECVGVLFPYVADLFYYCLNGNVPEEIPADYLADMADLCLADPEIQKSFPSRKVLCEAQNLHAFARKAMRETDSLPKAIVERLRENIGEFPDTVH